VKVEVIQMEHGVKPNQMKTHLKGHHTNQDKIAHLEIDQKILIEEEAVVIVIVIVIVIVMVVNGELNKLMMIIQDKEN
jgi:hypothetical protein